MLEQWKGWISSALPLEYIIPFVLVLAGTFFLGDYIRDIIKEPKEVVVEVVESVSSAIDVLHLGNDVEEPTAIQVAYTVDQDITRVMRL